jgi:CDP-diacylglycerol--glycerol-3-phosphate 3-phosphatidyltransferase
MGQSSIPGANIWGKVKTVSQIGAIALLIAPLGSDWKLTSEIAFWLAVALTLISGVIYVLPSAKEGL